ncbi:hypothetical protein HanIR_Chr04g0202791 [Helianthus annuus]|nr:hypothetical protein HanIR_Chr04g0202791 [Helianthus annuus]
MFILGGMRFSLDFQFSKRSQSRTPKLKAFPWILYPFSARWRYPGKFFMCLTGATSLTGSLWFIPGRR